VEGKESKREDDHRERMQSIMVYLNTVICDPLVPPLVEAHQV